MATSPAHTVNDILQIISDLRGESSVSTDSSRIRAISRSEQDLAKRKFFKIHLAKDQSIGTGDGSTTAFTIGSATYPMRLHGLSEVFVGGTTEDKRYTVLDFHNYKNTYNQNNSARIAYEYYDQANDLWKVQINPAPSSGTAVTASWFYTPPTRTLTSDIVVCQDPYIIAYLALGDIYHGEDELQLEQQARGEAEQRIGELTGIDNAPAVNQRIEMSSSINQLRPRGIGTY